MGFTKDIIGTNESVGGINLFEKVQSTQPATPYTAGLMSATDKSKLDSLENYVHPDSGVVPGKYMQVDVNEQGHVVAGRELQNSTLEDYRIKDAYIDLSDNSIVLGSHRIKPITPSDKVRWEQIVDTPNTLKEFGVTDVALSDGTINIGGDLITPLTADSQIAADKIAGVIDLKNIPVGAMERCVVVEDDAARFALTTNDVQKGDTVKVTNPTPTMYMVVDESKLDSADGYVVYSAGNANSVPWSGITDKPDHYYELPPADINTLGGVIVGDNITVDTDGKISTHPPYVLPQATNSTLGGVKIGENLSMQSDGTLSVPNATSTTAGVVKAGNNINIGADGTISTEKYQLPTATNMRLGGVRIGKYLSVDSEGLLNATGVPITASKTDMGGVIIGENIDIDENGKISVTLPTKTSELENDSEFITTENLSLHNNDENAHASKFEAMHGQLVNVYNNVAEMKQSTRLKAGMAAKTLGYYSANDGGGAYYVIREKVDGDVDDGGSIHELASGLVAELIVENGTVNVKQFGAKGDGVTDDTIALKNAFKYGREITIPPNNIFCLTNRVIVYSNTIVNFDGVVKDIQLSPGDYNFGAFEFYDSVTETPEYSGVHDVVFRGSGTYDCNSLVDPQNFEMTPFRVHHCKNITIEGITIKNYGGFHAIESGATDGLIIRNVKFLGAVKNNGTSTMEAIQLEHTNTSGSSGAIPHDGTPTKNVIVEGCLFAPSDEAPFYCAIGVHSTGTGAVENVIFRNNVLENFSEKTSLSFLHPTKNITVENNTFINMDLGQDSAVMFFQNCDGVKVIGNNITNVTSNGIFIINCNNCLVANNNINKYNMGNFLLGEKEYCNAIGVFPTSSNIRVYNNIIYSDTEENAAPVHIPDSLLSNLDNNKKIYFHNNICNVKTITSSHLNKFTTLKTKYPLDYVI